MNGNINHWTRMYNSSTMLPLLLHPPKTGGTSIHNALIQIHGADAVPMEWSLRSTSPAETHGLGLHHKYHEFNLPDNYPAVITVRDPYARLWSLFIHMLNYRINTDSVNFSDIEFSSMFKRFLKLLCRQENEWAVLISQPQSNWMCEHVQQVIRFENFVHDFNTVFGIDINQYPHVYNRGAVKINQVAKFYSQAHLDLVNHLSQNDFEMFGYTKYNHIEEMRDIK